MKNIILPFLGLFLMVSCKKNESSVIVPVITQTQNALNITSKNKALIISICHRTNSASNSWTTIDINVNAVGVHLDHGDIVPDADGDGFTKMNPCGTGSQNDCDDDNDSIYPGALEICDGIDNNCNGLTDDNCTTVVTICNQVWMTKNLDVTKYRNGDDIPQVTDQTTWNSLTTGAWCYYNNESVNGPVYGKLYNWYAVNDPRGLAPNGWHIPTYNEWDILDNCVGNNNPFLAGGELKEAGTTHWLSPNTGATNSSGFTGLPGGLLQSSGSVGMGFIGYWWSSSESSSLDAWSHGLRADLLASWGESRRKFEGYSVRCVKD